MLGNQTVWDCTNTGTKNGNGKRKEGEHGGPTWSPIIQVPTNQGRLRWYPDTSHAQGRDDSPGQR